MWKAVVLTASVLVAGTCATEEQPEFGVKLCGREFIRAVIFTCGGSRWRRAMMSPVTDDVSRNPSSASRDEASDTWSPNPAPGPPSQRLPETAAAVRPWRGGEEPSFRRSLEALLEALRSADRKERDVVVGLSNVCCKWGCSKNEISSLC